MKTIRILLIVLIAGIGLLAFSTLSKVPAEVALATNLNQVDLQVGDKAPDIKLKNPDGKLIALSSIKGKLVLIDFWASWCGPCRRENPNVVKAYNTYKNKTFKGGTGFTIYSVSLDAELSAWKNAIKTDKLAWENHVSDLKGWESSAATLYNVTGIPTNYLINSKGVILAIGLRGSELEDFLKGQVK